jgi:hypothetical protein
MEAVKGFIFDHKKVKIGSETAYKYIVCMVLITDQPIENLNEDDANSETIIGGESPLNMLSDALNCTPKFKLPKYLKTLGDVSHGILTVSDMNINDLERTVALPPKATKPPKKVKRRKNV